MLDLLSQLSDQLFDSILTFFVPTPLLPEDELLLSKDEFRMLIIVNLKTIGDFIRQAETYGLSVVKENLHKMQTETETATDTATDTETDP